MVTFLTYMRLVVYIIGNITSIPALAILLRNRLLHRNFRFILIIIIISSYIFSLVVYLHYLSSIIQSLDKEEIIDMSNVLLYYGAAMFVYGNLCLTIERWIAACFVASYEKYSSKKISAIITVLCVVLPAAVFSFFATKLPPGHVLIILSFSACSLASVAISGYLRFCKSTRVTDANSSLASRFQIKENNKTMVIYFSMSLNELATATMMVVLVCMSYTNHEGFEWNKNGYSVEVLDLVSIMALDDCVHNSYRNVKCCYELQLQLQFFILYRTDMTRPSFLAYGPRQPTACGTVLLPARCGWVSVGERLDRSRGT
ncbi:hypothetical protein Y032_0012g1617 [Ancylostoma ceylanicum]|nr:hypothetical protein Y032_0012g1617 [Ancylostoma ceylanicum]